MSQDPTPPRPSLFPLAVVSFVLGLLALVPGVLILAGLPALLLGYASLRVINGSDGRRRGRPWAVAGMVLGGLGTLASAVLFLGPLLLEVRERANRVTCQNQLRVIGQALTTYSDSHQHYPTGTVPSAELPPDKRLSWMAELLPDLGKMQLGGNQTRRGDPQPKYASLDVDLAKGWEDEANRSAVNTVIPEFVCPSYDRRPAPGTPGLTTYVGLAGIGPDAATLPLDDKRAGFFGYDRVLTWKQLQEWRGESRTAIVGETAYEVGPWAAGGFPTVRPLDRGQLPADVPADRQTYIGPGLPFGGIHATGGYFLFADGSVEFFRNGLSAAILESLVPIHDQ